MTDTTPGLTIPGPTRYLRAMTTDPDQLARDHARLAEFDVVQLRQDPPFDMAYITTTHLLERLQPHTLVVNPCPRTVSGSGHCHQVKRNSFFGLPYTSGLALAGRVPFTPYTS